MTTLQSIQSTIADELNRLNERIKSQLTTSNTLMNEVMSSYLRTKGKQIRPMIVILTARLFGEVNDRTLAAAAAVELLHNASLIHDDVVDNSKMRRSQPTINAIWDNHIAVLVGDYFVSSAMQQAISTGDVRVIDALCYLGKLLSLGELDQIYNARNHGLTETMYLHIINYKTASLFVACARMGCYSVGATDEQTEIMAEFARLLGLCFQIRDDIFDYFADDRIGKPYGNDLREGKVTLPLLHVLTDETLPDHDEMLAMIQGQLPDDEQIRRLTAYAIKHGGIDYAYAKMAELRDRGAAVLAQLGDNHDTRALLDVFDNIIARDY